jgi:hypothetical protein
MDAEREKLLSLLRPERQAKIRRELEVLSSLDLPAMSDAALVELSSACDFEITRRRIRVGQD